MAPVGPCCSVEPRGTITPLQPFRYSSTSGQLRSCSRIASTLAAGPGSGLPAGAVVWGEEIVTRGSSATGPKRGIL